MIKKIIFCTIALTIVFFVFVIFLTYSMLFAKGVQSQSSNSSEGEIVGGIIITSDFVKPLNKYTVTSRYGYRSDPFTGVTSFHRGIDLKAPLNTDTFAVANGKVVFSGWTNDYGNLITIDHGDCLTRYAHMNYNLVKTGDIVNQGELIGRVGTTGPSTGYHLHFEVLVDLLPINPESKISF